MRMPKITEGRLEGFYGSPVAAISLHLHQIRGKTEASGWRQGVDDL